jgi:hypothetical protein
VSKSKKQPEVIPVHPCLVAYNHPENGLVVMLDNNEFDAPAIWGIVLADIVQHLVNAYVKDGMSAREVRSDIISMLMTELETPTAKAQRKEASFVDGGFMINDEEEEE